MFSYIKLYQKIVLTNISLSVNIKKKLIMKKLLLILLAIIMIVVGVVIGLSSLYFIAMPLPKWLTGNPVASFFYSTNTGHLVYTFMSMILGYILVICSFLIIEIVEPSTERPKNQPSSYNIGTFL